jgi:hypothetical protein
LCSTSSAFSLFSAAEPTRELYSDDNGVAA